MRGKSTSTVLSFVLVPLTADGSILYLTMQYTILVLCITQFQNYVAIAADQIMALIN